MSFVVTAATGNVGIAALRALLEHGEAVLAVSRTTAAVLDGTCGNLIQIAAMNASTKAVGVSER